MACFLIKNPIVGSIVKAAFEFTIERTFGTMISLCKLFDVSYLQVVFQYETFEIRISPCDGHQEVGHICSIVECTEYHEYLFLFQFMHMTTLNFLFEIEANTVQHMS